MSADALADLLATCLDGAWPTGQPVYGDDIARLARNVLAAMGAVTTEWSLRDPEGGTTLIDRAFSVTEEEARAMLARRPGYVLVRRERWNVVTGWEDATDG